MVTLKQVLAGMLLAVFFSSIGCVEKKDGNTPVQKDQIRSAIEAQNQKFMETLRSGNMDAFGTLFIEESAKMMPPNRKAVVGRDSIIAFMGNMRKQGLFDINLSTKELYPYSSHAIEVGEYEVYLEGKDKVDEGKYLVFWKKSDGKWRIYREIWNSNQSARSSE